MDYLFYVFLALIASPGLLAVWFVLKELKQIKKFSFGLPELLALPIVATPALLSIAYVQNQGNIFIGIALSIMVIYQVVFALLFWVKGKRGRWWGALNLVTGTVVGTVTMISFGTILAFFIRLVDLRF
jgi:hypothetical protein